MSMSVQGRASGRGRATPTRGTREVSPQRLQWPLLGSHPCYPRGRSVAYALSLSGPQRGAAGPAVRRVAVVVEVAEVAEVPEAEKV
jgi:hypothetical protein